MGVGYIASVVFNRLAVEAEKLEYDHPPTPKPGEEGQLAFIVPGPSSNFLESTLYQSLYTIHNAFYAWPCKSPLKEPFKGNLGLSRLVGFRSPRATFRNGPN